MTNIDLHCAGCGAITSIPPLCGPCFADERLQIAHRAWLAVHCHAGVPKYTARGAATDTGRVHGPITYAQYLARLSPRRRARELKLPR